MGLSVSHYFPLTTIDSRSWAKLFMTYAELQRSKKLYMNELAVNKMVIRFQFIFILNDLVGVYSKIEGGG